MLRLAIALCIMLIQQTAIAQAQKTISNITFIQPITVKEPTVFKNCKFEAKPFSSTVTVRKKASASFEHCQFSGNLKSKGIVAFGQITVSESQFKGFAVAVELKKAKEVSLTANTFIANHTAIRCNTGDATNPLNLTLKCNRFEPGAISQNEQRFGLVVDDGTAMSNIGGGAGFNEPPPNANAWPVVDRTVPFANWVNPVGWVSLENNSGIEFQYWRYQNEFVQDNIPVDVDLQFNQQNAFTAPFSPPNPIPGIDVEVCDNFLDLVFPYTRPVGNDPGTGKPEANAEKAKLGNAQPNPAKETTRVAVYLPENEASYLLELWDVSGKRKFAAVEPKGKGSTTAELLIQGLPKGIYLYRLTENGVPIGTRRLAVH